MIDWQWYRALAGTIVEIIGLVVFLYLSFTTKFFSFIGIISKLSFAILYFIMLYINYKFIQFNDIQIDLQNRATFKLKEVKN